VQSQENPLTNMFQFGLWEFQPFVTMTAHIFGVSLFLCNRDAFNKWPAAVQDVVRRAAREATLANRRYAAEPRTSANPQWRKRAFSSLC